MAAGRKSTFTYTKASRLGEVHVADLPNTKAWLQAKLRDTLYPLLASRFGGAAGDVVAADELAVYDSLVIKYDASRGGTRTAAPRRRADLGEHRAQRRRRVHGRRHLLRSARGRRRLRRRRQRRRRALAEAWPRAGPRERRAHAGHPSTSGERWVLVVFILAKRAEQLARRCGELAVEERRAGRVDEAHAAFEAGLAACGGTDHELHHGLAGVLAMKGEFAASRGAPRDGGGAVPAVPRSRRTPWAHCCSRAGARGAPVVRALARARVRRRR